LQDLSLSMRMVPLHPTFQKMTRLVRDLARKSSKAVQFITEGEDTEIDRNMVDIINDPLVHIIRNAVDHGIETNENRKKAGKPKQSIVKLSALSQGENIIVKVEDDGKGLDRDKIIQKSIQRGIIASGEGLTDRDIQNLIFEPGFSTADEVSDISGRGVGLDVVREGVEALRGTITIASIPGQGTSFTIRLPLTLAITDGMIGMVGNERYIIPTVNISTTLHPKNGDLSTVTGNGEMIWFRERFIPVIRLYDLFNIPEAVEDPCEGLLIVVNSTDREYAVLVDELIEHTQVVIKSLGEGMGKVDGISGGAILGDGNVGLILDTAGIWDLVVNSSFVLEKSIEGGDEDE
ncbi:chemotaxis protein CheA, partial [Planctomycetota bacterium]